MRYSIHFKRFILRALPHTLIVKHPIKFHYLFMFSVQTTRFFFLSDRVITKRLLYDISPSHSKKLSSRTKADWKKNTFSIMQPVSGLLDVITKKGSSFVIDCGVYWKYKGRQRKNCTLCRMAYGECGIILIVKLRKRIWIVSPSRTRCCKSVMISIELAQQRAIETITARQMFLFTTEIPGN